MKLQEINQKLNKLKNQTDKLSAEKRKKHTASTSYWNGKFCMDVSKNLGMIDQRPTPRGLKELEKYNIDYSEKPTLESNDLLWEVEGISYTPKKRFCMICGDTKNLEGEIQFGLAPRFATCIKHGDFLILGSHLRKRK